MRLAVHQHLRALDDGRDEVVYHNAFHDAPRWLRWLAPDYVVLHPTFMGVRWNDDFARYRDQYAWLRKLACPKIALPQDEYDHSEVLEEWLAEIAVTHIFSCFGSEQRLLLYPNLDGALPFTETLTGYIDDRAAAAIVDKLVPAKDRPFDIVYRAAKLPYWFGRHGQLKHRLAVVVDEPARARGLRTDISTRWEDTIFGSEWLDFVMSGRATIGAESGSSVLDRRGEMQARIRRLLADEPELTFDEVDRRMPHGWDSYAFFAISPRHLEAVITKTCQVLIEGSYSGVLVPDRHYIPLRRDLSNLDAVLDRLHDIDACVEVADTAYREVYEHGQATVARLAEDIRIATASGRRSPRLQLPVRLVRCIQPPSLPGRILGPLQDMSMRMHLTIGVWLTIVRTLAHHPGLRRLTASWLRRSPRPSLRQVAGDVLRLGALERLRTEPPNEYPRWWISARVTDGTLLLRSEVGPPDRSRLRATKPYIRILWDHSAVGTSAPLYPNEPQRAIVSVGGDGRYSFDALATLGARDEVLLMRTLQEFEPA